MVLCLVIAKFTVRSLTTKDLAGSGQFPGYGIDRLLHRFSPPNLAGQLPIGEARVAASKVSIFCFSVAIASHSNCPEVL